MYESGVDTSSTFAAINVQNALTPELVQMLLAPSIMPGSEPDYQLCKTIFTDHPIGAILADAPIKRAQSKERILSLARVGEDVILEQFRKKWNELNGDGATRLIRRLYGLSRMYGISSLAVGEKGKAPNTPLRLDQCDFEQLYFNSLDPLNTAGSLVLDQDPNNPNFLKPQAIRVNGVSYHPSRTFCVLNEEAIYIDWTQSAFGFVGRSVYQRPLFPLKSFIRSMFTDDMVQRKVGLLVYKAESPGSVITNVMKKMAGAKRALIKQGNTDNVVQIGLEEELASLDLQHVHDAGEYSRTNIIKNIASGAGMPASIIFQELMQAGLGDGTEDAKKESGYISEIREMMNPLYAFVDRIVMYMAWTPDFYKVVQRRYRADYGTVPYETAFADWLQAFEAIWPNPIDEPDSEIAKNQDVRAKGAVAVFEVIFPHLDPENAANAIDWLAQNINELDKLFAGNLNIDLDLLKAHLEECKTQQDEAAMAATEGGEGGPKAPQPFSARS